MLTKTTSAFLLFLLECLEKCSVCYFRAFKVREGESPWSDFFWPAVLGWVQRVSGLGWGKLGPGRFRASQNASVSLNFWVRGERCSVSLQGPALREPSWAHSASLCEGCHPWTCCSASAGQRCAGRGGLLFLEILLAHLSLHLKIAAAFPIWWVALGVCVAHLLGPLLSLCPLRRPPFWKSDLASSVQLLLHSGHQTVEVITSHSSLQSYLSFPTFCSIHKLHHHHEILCLFLGCW